MPVCKQQKAGACSIQENYTCSGHTLGQLGTRGMRRVLVKVCSTVTWTDKRAIRFVVISNELVTNNHFMSATVPLPKRLLSSQKYGEGFEVGLAFALQDQDFPKQILSGTLQGVGNTAKMCGCECHVIYADRGLQ